MNTVVAMTRDNSQNHLVNLGITNVWDLQLHLQKIFEDSEHQNTVMAKLYKLVFPDWEKILRIEGFPEVGQALWDYICNLYIEFDRVHHPGCLKGGTWINQGFSSSDKLNPWEISIKGCKIFYS